MLLKYGKHKHEWYRITLLSVHVFVTILLLINIFFSYKKDLKIKILRGESATNDDLLNTGKWKVMIFEFVLNLIAPMPFLYDIEYNEYHYKRGKSVKAHVNTALFIAMMIFRIYHFSRTLLISTDYISARADRI